MNHEQDYPAEYLTGILKEVKTIAMVGASSDPAKFSYGVLRVLHETGYDMIPVSACAVFGLQPMHGLDHFFLGLTHTHDYAGLRR